ncbi:immunoglobulin superfamily member 5 [Chanos chanos]|uniref:immunoglobulin superfamily member 5 n=1 Tax=Chanos chanos TaxID=29144 RepID=UPI0011F40385|nr:immunoglobulin superfamily member 5-like [Chanos chanos]
MPTKEAVGVPVQIEPQNAVVLVDAEARFNCSPTAHVWHVMIWSVGEEVVLTVVQETGSVENSDRFSAVNYTTTESQRWELIVRNVSRSDSGPVTCAIQNIGRQTANLTVQERGTVNIVGGDQTITKGEEAIFQCQADGWFPEPHISWTLNGVVVDKNSYNTTKEEQGSLFNSVSVLRHTALGNSSVECLASVPAMSTPLRSSVYLIVGKRNSTVLIAVTVSFGSAALLALLIIAIVFCCKKKKKARSTYQEEVRARSQSVRQGTNNLGYVTDNSDSVQRPQNGKHLTMADSVNSQGYDLSTISGNGIRKHRHQTIV